MLSGFNLSWIHTHTHTHTHIAILQAAEPPPPAATPSVLRLQPLCLSPWAKQDKEAFYTRIPGSQPHARGKDCAVRQPGILESARDGLGHMSPLPVLTWSLLAA